MTNLTDELTRKTKVTSEQPGGANSPAEIKIDPTSDRINVSEITKPSNDQDRSTDSDNPDKPETSYRFLRYVSDRTGQSLIMLGLFGLILSTQFRTQLWLIPAGLAVAALKFGGRIFRPWAIVFESSGAGWHTRCFIDLPSGASFCTTHS